MILSAVKSYVTKDKFIIWILNLIAINESYKLNNYNYSLVTKKKKKKNNNNKYLNLKLYLISF